MPKVFGYGSLRSDLGRSFSYPPRGKSLGFGFTPGELWLICNTSGYWAGVKEVPETKLRVYGETFEVDDFELGVLDSREGINITPPCYYRKSVQVSLSSGEVIEAFVYFAGPDRTEWKKLIPSGHWRDLVRLFV